MNPPTQDLVRLAWHVAEPIHAVLYFAPETAAATNPFDLPVGWMTYFGCRAAPLGRASAATVTSVFYHLAPEMVARSVPELWDHAEPQRFLDARLSAMDAALHRLLGSADVARAAELAAVAAAAVEDSGRALGAANAALPLPVEPRLALWQALTTLREYRGDGHIAALVAAEISPCEAHVLADAAGRASEADSKRYHRWSDSAWSRAHRALAARGWLASDGTLTAAGNAAVDEIEHDTDRLARHPYVELGSVRTKELVTLLRPLADQIISVGAVPVPNPVGFDWPPSGD